MIDFKERVKNIDLVSACAFTEYFCKEFFPERFNIPFSAKIHRPIMELLDDPTKRKVAIAAPRDTGKTSLLNAYIEKCLLFEEVRYVIRIGGSLEEAVRQTENIKNHLEDNDFVRALFPTFKTNRWSKEEFMLSNGALVTPKGAGQRIRGGMHRDKRPDLIVLDDIENDENVMSEDQRLKLKQWFLAAVRGLVQHYGESNWRIIFIGTVLHEDSLLSRLLDDPTWTSTRLELCDDNFVSNWPEGISDKEIKNLYDEYVAQGEQDVFAREYRNLPVNPDSSKFKSTYFQYYDESEEELNSDPRFTSVVLGDPAKTHAVHSCDSGIAGITVDLDRKRIYIRELIAEQMTPDEFIDNMLNMAIRINARILAPEVTSLNEYLTWPLQNAMAQRGLYFQVIEVKPRDKKEVRAAALIDPYRRKLVYHHRENCRAFEQDLMAFPRCKMWDRIDSVAHILPVMEELHQYFHDEGMVLDPVSEENKLKMLRRSDEPAIAGWRIA